MAAVVAAESEYSVVATYPSELHDEISQHVSDLQRLRSCAHFVADGTAMVFGPGGTTAGGGAWYPTPQMGGSAKAADRRRRLRARPVRPGRYPFRRAGPHQRRRGARTRGLRGASRCRQTPQLRPHRQAMPCCVEYQRAWRPTHQGYVHKYGWRYSVMTRPPAGG